MFSLGVKISGLDDFVEPSQDCIKPVTSEVDDQESLSNQKGLIKVEQPDGSFKSMPKNISSGGLKKAKITLNDCLACSGCVTTAETILIQQQSHMQVLESIKTRRKGMVFVATVSPQSISSLAAFYDLSFVQTAERLCASLKSIGVDFVFDSNVGRNLTLLQSAQEFVDRFRNHNLQSSNNDKNLPLFTSSCPGWICYAEKTHGDFILPYISRVKSPQQVMGTIVKRHFSQRVGVPSSDIFHFTIMPCYDKKLEATRDDFIVPGSDGSGVREVDCVIATNELFLLLTEACQSAFLEQSPLPFDNLHAILQSSNYQEPYNFYSHEGSGSGGYVEYVFKYAAKQLFNVDDAPLNFTMKRKNANYKELFLIIDGEVKLKFAVANGFRNLGNFAMKLKKKNLNYDYVEIMACPSGCLNGGGQLRAVNNVKESNLDEMNNAASNTQSEKLLLERVTNIYQSVDKVVPFNPLKEQQCEGMAMETGEGDGEEMMVTDCADSESLFFTSYKSVPKMEETFSLNIKW